MISDHQVQSSHSDLASSSSLPLQYVVICSILALTLSSSECEQCQIHVTIQQIAQSLMHNADSLFHVSVNQYHVQASLHDILCKTTSITPHDINALDVNLVIPEQICPAETCIAFLSDEQVRKVCFLELKVNRVLKMRRDKLRSPLAELHDLCKIRVPELDHD